MNAENIKGLVIICRHPGDYETAAIDAAKISGVHWSCISGGIRKRQAGRSLYGYIPYEDAIDLVACSGRHNFGYNDAKICITASYNKDDPKYCVAYYALVEIADEKAKCGIAAKCPVGAPSCTKRIRQLLTNTPEISRRNLRTTLCSEGYEAKTITEAINNLKWQKIIELDGDSRSSKQIIRMRQED